MRAHVRTRSVLSIVFHFRAAVCANACAAESCAHVRTRSFLSNVSPLMVLLLQAQPCDRSVRARAHTQCFEQSVPLHAAVCASELARQKRAHTGRPQDGLRWPENSKTLPKIAQDCLKMALAMACNNNFCTVNQAKAKLPARCIYTSCHVKVPTAAVSARNALG